MTIVPYKSHECVNCRRCLFMGSNFRVHRERISCWWNTNRVSYNLRTFFLWVEIIYIYICFWSKVNTYDVNCARETAFIFYTRTVSCESVNIVPYFQVYWRILLNFHKYTRSVSLLFQNCWLGNETYFVEWKQGMAHILGYITVICNYLIESGTPVDDA